jgi:hypothetical protein
MADNTLEQQVSAALGNPIIGASELEDLITHVEDGIKDAERNVTKQREAAFDPAISPDLTTARQRLEDASFLLGRLKTLRPRLERRLAQVIAAEQRARWEADFNKVAAQRDAAVAAFNKYPALLADLLDILYAAEAVDKECARINATAPSGESRRLAAVELAARGLDAFNVDYPSISKRLTLPDFQSARMLWPPQQPAVIVPPQPADVRSSADWGVHRDAQLRAEREKAERDREECEAAAEEGQRRSGAPIWWKPNGNAIE